VDDAVPSKSPSPSPEPVRLRSIPIERAQPSTVAPGAARAIPKPLTSLIGREDDVAAVRALIEDEGVRLVTLTGPGGVGKTRLALRIGEALAATFPDGVVFAPLAAIVDPELVLPSILRALGLREDVTRSAAEVLADALRQKRLLLVLDNFEQVRSSAAHLAALLATCPDLVMLVTSRALLHIAGEQRFPVSPLALPESVPAGPGLPLATRIAAAPAVQLFVARARALEPAFALDEDNAVAVAAICRRLDGLPLAIELAAPRILLLSPGELLARLRPALPLLNEGRRMLRIGCAPCAPPSPGVTICSPSTSRSCSAAWPSSLVGSRWTPPKQSEVGGRKSEVNRSTVPPPAPRPLPTPSSTS
jgi:hypothetical protein